MLYDFWCKRCGQDVTMDAKTLTYKHRKSNVIICEYWGKAIPMNEVYFPSPDPRDDPAFQEFPEP